jgi:hypothetical protein
MLDPFSISEAMPSFGSAVCVRCKSTPLRSLAFHTLGTLLVYRDFCVVIPSSYVDIFWVHLDQVSFLWTVDFAQFFVQFVALFSQPSLVTRNPLLCNRVHSDTPVYIYGDIFPLRTPLRSRR